VAKKRVRAKAVPARNRSPEAAEDASRIVPLYIPREQPLAEGVVAAPPARLTYRGGPLLTGVEVFTIFWGAQWTKQQAGTAGEINAFFDFVLTSPLIDQLAEYDVPGKSIGHGKRTGTVKLPSPAPATSVSDTAIRKFLQNRLAAKRGGLPKPSPNSLYFLFLPPGVRVSAFGGLSCQSFCGYHDAISKKIFYAVMPFPGCSGCRGGVAVVDALTLTSSHELCEAITDPIPGNGWYDDNNGEIGDICAWQSKKLGQYTVQQEWSNKAGRCV
jgi:hypothetical protein